MNPDNKSAVKEAAATLHEAVKEGREILEEINDTNRELAKSLRELALSVLNPLLDDNCCNCATSRCTVASIKTHKQKQHEFRARD